MLNFIFYGCFLFIISLVSSQTTVSAGSGTVILQYVDSLTFQVTFKGKLGDWMGLGFGRAHTGNDMNIAEFLTSSTYSLMDSYSDSQSAPPDDTQLGGTFDLKNLSYSTDSSSNAIISYTRAFNTGDRYDAVLSPDSSFLISLAWGPGTIHNHGGSRKTTTISISSSTPAIINGNSTNSGNSTNTNSGNSTNTNGGGSTVALNFWSFHGISLMIIWTGLNFLGYASARFFRYNPLWEWLHLFFSGLFSLGGILIMAYSVIQNPGGWTDISMSIHVTFGYILLGLTTLQFLLGLIEYFSIYCSKRLKSSAILSFKIYHKIIGIFLTFSSYLLLMTAQYVYTPVIYPIILTAVFLGLIIISEIIHYRRHAFIKIKSLGEFLYHFDSKSKQIKKFNLAQLNDEKKYTQYVIYDNYVCDVGSYFKNHPGGSMMIEDNMYLDVGRYLTGTQEYSKNFKPHSHNLSTFKNLVEKMCYARILDDHKIIITQNRSDFNNSEVNNLSRNTVYFDESYVMLVDKRLIAKDTYEYKFKSTKGLGFAKILPGVSWMGRHFSISCYKLNKTRYYSISLSLTEEMKEKHLILLENVRRLERKEEIINVQMKEKDKYSDNFCLHIKRYNHKNTLSGHLFNLDTKSQTDLLMKGPLGVGLNIYDNKLTGTYVIFGAGTGIVPFLDMITFTLRYMVYKISKNSYKTETNLLIPHEDLIFKDIIDSSFKIHLFVTFANPESAVYMDVFQELVKLESKYNLNIFKLTVRYSSEKTERWNNDFIHKSLKDIRNSINKVYLIGPTPFMDDIKAGLIETEIADKDKIILV